MNQVSVAPQGYTVVMSQPFIRRSPEKYKRTLWSLGIAEITLGVISLLLAIAGVVLANEFCIYYYFCFSRIGTGIWCGIPLIVTGILGVVAKWNPTSCMFNGNMAMSIVSTIMMLPLIFLSCFGLFDGSVGATAIHSALIAIGVIAFFITIVHSAYCCAGVCCNGSNESRLIYLPQGQSSSAISPDQHVVAYQLSPYQVTQNPGFSSVRLSEHVTENVDTAADQDIVPPSYQEVCNPTLTDAIPKETAPLPSNYGHVNLSLSSDVASTSQI